MVFSSPVFIFLFLPIVYLINLVIPKRFSNGFLLIFSLIFYAWGEPLYVFLMIFSGLINYILTLSMGEQSPKRKVILIIAVIFNIGILGLFKYADFLILTVNGVLKTSLPLLNLPLPIGISFYTFQTMSYVFDVYNNETAVQKNYFSLLLYITFFPQLIAGPIVQYHDIARQIESRFVTLDKTVQGLRRFVVGLSKKVLLANAMAVIADRLFALPNSEISTVVAWIASIAYLFQIYFDFSGYSDMAIGMGEMFGFHFKENFNYPYIATSVQDFWRRWHISLSSWFRLYVLEQTVLHVRQWPVIVQRLYTLLVVLIGFVIFRAETFGQSLIFIQSMFAFTSASALASKELMILITPFTTVMFAISVIASTPLLKNIKGYDVGWTSVLSYGFTIVLWIACLLSLAANTYNPFIYFRF